MKKNLLLLGAILAVSAISVQTAFADKSEGKQAPKEITVEVVSSKPDFSKVKIVPANELNAVGKVTGTFSGTTSAPVMNIVSAGTIDPTAIKDLKIGELKAVGKVTGSFAGTTSK